MTSINLLGFVLLAISCYIIAYECQSNRWGYMAIILAAIGGKWLLTFT